MKRLYITIFFLISLFAILASLSCSKQPPSEMVIKEAIIKLLDYQGIQIEIIEISEFKNDSKCWPVKTRVRHIVWLARQVEETKVFMMCKDSSGNWKASI